MHKKGQKAQVTLCKCAQLQDEVMRGTGSDLCRRQWCLQSQRHGRGGWEDEE